MRQFLLSVFLGFSLIIWNAAFARANSYPTNGPEATANTPSAVEGKSGSFSANITSATETFLSAEAAGLYYDVLTREFKFNSNSYTRHERISDPIIVPEENTELLSDSSQYHIKRANSIYDRVMAEQRFIDVLNDATVIDLPLGISKSGGSSSYTILIDSLIITPRTAYLTTYMVLELPQNGRKLVFKGMVGFSEKGLSGEARMKLVEDVPIKFGENTLITIKGQQGGTFVEWDCNGFRHMGVDAELEFSRNFIVPEKPDGTPNENERLKTRFSTIITDWNDLIVTISLDPFQVKGIPGLGIEVTQATFDFSDLNNTPSFKLPADYNSTLIVDGNLNLWQGIYISEARIKLPPQLKTKGSTKRIELVGQEMMIDNMGFTGIVSGENLLSLENGDMNGWAFSLNTISIAIQANQIKEAGFNGLIKVPALDDDSPLAYKAIMNMDNDYVFTVETTANVKMSALAADLTLYPSSFLEVKMIDNKFVPKAVLNGNLSVNARVGGEGSTDKASLVGIAFEQLQIASEKPYISVGALSLGSEALEQKMSKYPIALTNIGIRSRENELALSCSIVVNLVGEKDGGFGATGGLTVRSVLEENENSRKRWKYKTTDLDAINVNISTGGGVKIQGGLVFYKTDPTFGSGFQGNVSAEFGLGIKAAAAAQFGNVNGMRYWYADALASIPSGVPVFTGFGIYGIGGGAYFHMKSIGMSASPSGNLGKTPSGIVYVPDENTNLGVKATVEYGVHPQSDPMNGDATFEIAFNRHGGVNKIAFRGNSYFITPPISIDVSKIQSRAKALSSAAGNGEVAANNTQPDASSGKGSMYGALYMEYDFINKTLHGNLDVFVNVAGVIKGTGPRNRAGGAVMHFSPNEWYVYMGTPDQRMGLELMSMVKSGSYFMMGSTVPGSPPPPSNVTEILGGLDLDYMRDMNALGNGKGFAFGSSITMNTGDLKFMMFYARFAAGLGFDVMLKNYGEARCKGATSTIGVNGWYANGQAYAYFQGKIGIAVKLPFYSGNYDIIDLGAAAILQAKLPNPLWMQGNVGGYYSILGGMVKGNCKFQVTIGQQCEIVGGSALSGIKVIADITPANGTKDINVFNAPQAVFNMPVNKVFEIVDLDGFKKSFKVVLDDFSVKEASGKIAGSHQWNEDFDVVAFKTVDVLPGKKDIKVRVKISFQEYKNGLWVAVKSNGKTVTEEMESTFTTGADPDRIPLNQVAYSYPVINQLNYYKDESPVGYISLNMGIPSVFKVSKEWKQKARITSATGERYIFDYTVSDNKEISFEMPKGLNAERIYTLELVNIPAQANSAVDANVDTVLSAMAGNDKADVLLRTKAAEGDLALLEEKSIYTAHFRTSQFSTFRAKLDALKIHPGASVPIMTGIHEIRVAVEAKELFDKAEILGEGNNLPLIEFTADLSNTWYNNHVKPLVYLGYPVQGLKLSRAAEPYGVPPAKATYVRQTVNNKQLSEKEVLSNVADPAATTAALIYNLSYQMYKDYLDLRLKAASHPSRTSNTWMMNIISKDFQSILSGNYNVTIRYVLPGRRGGTTVRDITFNNP